MYQSLVNFEYCFLNFMKINIYLKTLVIVFKSLTVIQLHSKTSYKLLISCASIYFIISLFISQNKIKRFKKFSVMNIIPKNALQKVPKIIIFLPLMKPKDAFSLSIFLLTTTISKVFCIDTYVTDVDTIIKITHKINR